MTNDTRPRLRLALAACCAVVAIVAAGCIPPAGTVPHTSPPAPAGCITDVGPTDKMVVTGCGAGITYNVSVPDRCLDFACGLIVDVHGWTMTGDIQELNTGIAAIGREEGYIVVQPTAPGAPPSWNSSHYPLVAAFAQLAVDVWRVDARRVHVTGFSQGGAMTTWMRCNRSSLFASAAPTAMAGSGCSNGNNMPTLYIQGNNDIFVSQTAIANTIASYRATYGYDLSFVIADEPGYVKTGYGSSTATVPAFETFIHNYSSFGVNGHCIMGSVTPSDPYGCDEPTPVGHGRMVVDFFKANPRRA
jgi:poly(3-hydroxybutyrate) depolymerase